MPLNGTNSIAYMLDAQFSHIGTEHNEQRQANSAFDWHRLRYTSTLYLGVRRTLCSFGVWCVVRHSRSLLSTSSGHTTSAHFTLNQLFIYVVYIYIQSYTTQNTHRNKYSVIDVHEIGETWSIGRSFVHTGRRIQHTHGHYFHRNWHWPARWSLKATNQPVVDKRRCSISFWPCGAHIYIYMVVAIGDVDRNG